MACGFRGVCGFYSDASFTCTHGGSDYCGVYRELKAKEEAGV